MRNKFFKRALAMAMSLCLVLSMGNIASAVETETESKIDLNLNVARGEKSVTAEIAITDNTVNFQDLQLKLGFDPTQLEFKGVQAGTSGMALTVNQAPNEKGSLNVVAAQPQAGNGKGVVYTATFNLKEGVAKEDELRLVVDSTWSEADTAAVNVIRNPIKFCVDVLGKLVSYKAGESDTSKATVALYKDDLENPIYSAQANEDSYTVMDVAPGAYTVKVTKPHHAPRTYQIEVDSAAVTQDAQLNLMGDVNLDGKVSLKDMNTMYQHINYDAELKDYALACGDVFQDENTGMVNLKDFNTLNEHINYNNPMW